MPDNAYDLIDERLEAMEREITEIYTRTEAEIEKTADEYFRKFKKLDDQKRRQVEAGKLSEEEYLEWKKNKILYSKRFSEMKQQCAEQILNVNRTAVAYVNGKLPEMYAIGYNDLKTAVDGIGGYSFTLISPDTVKRLITDKKSLLPLKAMNPAKDIPWNMKNINAEVLQGILQGESMDKIARRIRNVQEMNRASAIRTARTAVTGAENRGRQDSYKRAEKDGIILKKEWIATFDMRTRHAHAMLDGQLADQDKPFKSELGDIMYPGDPDAHPSNVYNCRCTTAAKVLGFRKQNKGLSAGDKNSGIGKAEQIGTVDFADKNQIYKILEDAEKECMHLPYEVNYTVTSDGKVWKVVGDKGFVNISSIPSDLKGSFSFHNHPEQETWYSFSAQDIAFFMDSRMQYAKASDNLFEYTIKRMPETIDSDYDTTYNMFNNIIKTEIQKLEWEGLIDADLDEYHEVVKRISKKYKFDYERRKINGNK